MSEFTKHDLVMAQAFASTFATPSGQMVLKELDRMYMNQNLYMPGDPYGSHVAIGSHLVVVAIYQLIALAHDPRAEGSIPLDEENDNA